MMDINDLMAIQVGFDKEHGFPIEFDSDDEKYRQISKDLVGLFGEVGEFANIVKKVTLHLERPSLYAYSIDEAEVALKEELVDSLIYLLRLAAILNVDLEHEYQRKVELNAVRYQRLK